MNGENSVAVVPVPMNILLVEDEVGDRELMEIALFRAERHHELHTVADGEEAMRYLRNEPPYETAPRPNLVILDLNLPRKDGREVLAEMKIDKHLQSIPVVVLSTSYDDKDVSSSYRLGACSYIVKPGNFRDFNTVVGRLQEYWFGTVALPRTT